jgi:uncharacterized protein (TIGR02246 family)
MSTPSPVRSAIEAADRQFEAAFGRGDAAGVAGAYTPNAQLFPPQSDVISGRQAIQGFWQAVMNMGVKAATLETVEVAHQGDTAYEVGRYTLKGGEGQVLDRGKYVVVWQREGNQWKLHRDIWNTSIAAAAQ